MKTLNTLCKKFQLNIIERFDNQTFEYIQKPQMRAFFDLVPKHTGKLASDLLHRSCVSIENKSGVPSEPADHSGNSHSHHIRNSQSHNPIKISRD